MSSFFRRKIPVKKNVFKRKRTMSNTVSSNSKIDKVEAVDLAYVSYERTGHKLIQSNPLIIMHGLFGSKANWTTTSRALLNETEPKRKIIVVDARNHGDSPHSPFHTYQHLAEDVKKLIEQMSLSKVALMGHSMGGRAMMHISLKYPELVEKLIVVDISPVSTSPTFRAVSSVIEAMRKVEFPVSVTMDNAKKCADMQLSLSIHSNLVRKFLLTNVLQESNGKFTWRLNIPALSKNKEHIFSFPKVEGLCFKGPTIFITGKMSDFIKKSDHPKILKLFPNATFHTIEKAGHWVHCEKPKLFLKLCIDFLNKNDAN